MKTQSSLQQTPAIAADPRPFGRTFLLKGKVLSPEPALAEDANPEPKPMKQDDLWQLIRENRSILFGEKTLGITAEIGGSPFDNYTFLFDFSESKPRCFILCMILAGAPFESFFMNMTRTFAFLRNPDNRRKIIETLAADIQSDKELKKVFHNHVGKDLPIPVFLSETIITRCRVLLLTDEKRQQIPEFVEAYPEAWRTMLSVICVSRYQVGKSQILSMHPALAELNGKPNEPKQRKPKVEHTEEHHLAKSATASAVYAKLKAAALKIDKNVIFNSKGKHYIAMKKPGGKNLAFFHLRKSLYLVVKLDEKIVRKMVKKNTIQSLPPTVQKFWNGASTGLVIETTDNAKEIVEVLKKLIKQ